MLSVLIKGTRVFVNKDLCPASHSIRKAQLSVLKQARNKVKIIYFRHTKLIVKEKTASNQTSESARRVVHARRSETGATLGGGRDDSADEAPCLISYLAVLLLSFFHQCLDSINIKFDVIGLCEARLNNRRTFLPQ